MPVQIVPIDEPISYLIKATGETDYILLTADFMTGIVTSAVLPPVATGYLTGRLQEIMSKIPVIADLEAGFAGLIRSLVSIRQVEAGSPVLADPSHVECGAPMSTSSALNDYAQGQSGGGGAPTIAEVTYSAPTATLTIGGGAVGP